MQQPCKESPLCLISLAVERPYTCRTGPGEHSQSLMERSTQDIRAENRRLPDDRLQPLYGSFSDRWIGADCARLGRGYRDGRSFELQFIQFAAQFTIVPVISAEDRDLNAVEAGRFDLFELGVMLLGDVRSPEKHIHTNFHMSGLMGNLLLVGITLSTGSCLPFFCMSRINSIK